MNTEQQRAAYAIVTAALAYAQDLDRDHIDRHNDLIETVETYQNLIDFEPTEVPLPWGKVVAGDQVKARDGNWYEVVTTAEKPGAVLTTITVKLPNGPVTLTKERALMTTVRRGEAGRAADLFGDFNFEVMAS